MQRTNKDNLISILDLIVESALQLPVRVIDEHQNAGTTGEEKKNEKRTRNPTRKKVIKCFRTTGLTRNVQHVSIQLTVSNHAHT